ncbi:MAG: DUF6206 family protein [Anaerolineae bacterium]
MIDLDVDLDLLQAFEAGLDPRHPERSAIPARVLGYGEISTTLEVGTESQRHIAYKRLPMFRTEEEAAAYQALHEDYVRTLRERIGLRVVPDKAVWFVDRRSGRVVVYIAQQKLPPEAIGHRAMQMLPLEDVRRLVQAVLAESAKVFDFNRQHQGELELGLDIQISNWAVVGFDARQPRLGDPIELAYFDTSSPLMRRGGVEQLNPEIFLRSAPSFLVWILRLLFLEDVMTRYYDFRKVAVDLVANFYKEQRDEWVPAVTDAVNAFFAERDGKGAMEPLTVKEVGAYYREDAMIWRLYLAFRKVDRALRLTLGREYPYILPAKIRR